MLSGSSKEKVGRLLVTVSGGRHRVPHTDHLMFFPVTDENGPPTGRRTGLDTRKGKRERFVLSLAYYPEIDDPRKRLIVSGSAMSPQQILEEVPKLTPEERQEVRDWLHAEEFPETDELRSAVDEGIRSSETEQSLSIEEVRD